MLWNTPDAYRRFGHANARTCSPATFGRNLTWHKKRYFPKRQNTYREQVLESCVMVDAKSEVCLVVDGTQQASQSCLLATRKHRGHHNVRFVYAPEENEGERRQHQGIKIPIVLSARSCTTKYVYASMSICQNECTHQKYALMVCVVFKWLYSEEREREKKVIVHSRLSSKEKTQSPSPVFKMASTERWAGCKSCHPYTHLATGARDSEAITIS